MATDTPPNNRPSRPEGVIRDEPMPERNPPRFSDDYDPNRDMRDDDYLRGGTDNGRRDPLEGDRGISPVGRRWGNSNTSKIAGVAAMAFIGILVIGLTWDRGDDNKEDEEVTPAEEVVSFETAGGQSLPPAAPPSPFGTDPLYDPNFQGQNVPPIDGSTSGAFGAGIPQQPPVDPRVAMLQEARRAPVMAFSNGQQVRSGGGVGGGSPQEALIAQLLAGGGLGAAQAAPAAASGATQGSTLDSMRESSGVSTSRARMLPNRNYLITAGTLIPCILQTALDSGTPGYATCVVPRDVYSDNGNVVLMERGTRILGEYNSGLRRGQKRLFVLWTRAITPRGVTVQLASPAADTLGRAGFDGDVENFFWQRFGGALLLSIVDDAAYVAGQSAAGGDINNTTRVPSRAGEIALQDSINIPPVLRKNQGEEVGIFVAQDFDFSSVYNLSSR